MIRSLPYTLVVLLCAACASTGIPQSSSAPEPTFGPAGQSVLLTATAQSLQATAVIVQAQEAQATAEAQATHSAFDGFVLQATAQAIARQATLDSRHATEQYRADIAASAEQAEHKTQTATAQTGALIVQATSDARATHVAEAQAVSQQSEAAANGETFRFVVLIIFVSLGFLFLSVAIGKVLWDAQHRALEADRHAGEMEDERVRRKQDIEMERARQLMIILLNGLKTTPYGLITTDPLTFRTQLMAGTGPLITLHGQNSLPPNEVGRAGSLIVNDGEDQHVVEKFTEEEQQACERMLAFLDAGIEFWNKLGRNGNQCNQVPSVHRYTKHNISPWKSGELWQEHKNLFGDALISTGKGTYCPTAYPTLGELREAVSRGRIRICLPVKVPVPPAEQVIPE